MFCPELLGTASSRPNLTSVRRLCSLGPWEYLLWTFGYSIMAAMGLELDSDQKSDLTVAQDVALAQGSWRPQPFQFLQTSVIKMHENLVLESSV